MTGEGKLEVENPAEALRNQDGTFKVISPYGRVFRVTCRRGSNMRIREVGESENAALSEPWRWQIEKIA
jgi:hypothetical protein